MSGLQSTFESIDPIPGHTSWTGKIQFKKCLPIMMLECRNSKDKIKYWGRKMQYYASTTTWWMKKGRSHRKLRRRKEKVQRSIKISVDSKAQRKSKQQLATHKKRNHNLSPSKKELKIDIFLLHKLSFPTQIPVFCIYWNFY